MSASTLRIGVLMPEVLGTYGDSGNALILAERARRRGIDAEVVHVGLTEEIPDSLDIYTLGGGEDTAQALAADKFRGTSGLARALYAGRRSSRSAPPCRFSATGTRMRGACAFPVWASSILRRAHRGTERSVSSSVSPFSTALRRL